MYLDQVIIEFLSYKKKKKLPQITYYPINIIFTNIKWKEKTAQQSDKNDPSRRKFYLKCELN